MSEGTSDAAALETRKTFSYGGLGCVVETSDVSNLAVYAFMCQAKMAPHETPGQCQLWIFFRGCESPGKI